MKKAKAFAALFSALCIVLSGSGTVYGAEPQADGTEQKNAVNTQQEPERTVIPWRANTSVEIEAESGELVNTGEGELYPLEVVEGDWASGGEFVKGFRSGDTIRFPYTAEKTGWYYLTFTYRSGGKNYISWSEENGKIRSGGQTVTEHDNDGSETFTMQVTIRIKEAGEGTLILGTDENNGPQIDKLEIAPATVSKERYCMQKPIRGTHGDINVYVNGELKKNPSDSHIYYYEGDALRVEIVPDEGYAVEDVMIVKEGSAYIEDEIIKHLGSETEYEIPDVNNENAIDGSSLIIKATFRFAHYIADNPLYLPSSTGSSVTAEAENGVLSGEDGYQLSYAYKADSAGVYDVTLTAADGTLPDTLSWTEESGKIKPGSVETEAGASSVTFRIRVLEQGTGNLIFTGDTGDGTGLDRFEITLAESDIKTVNLNTASEDGSYVIAGINDPGRAAEPEHTWANGHASYVYFGNYYQDEGKSVKTPVKWRVLDADTEAYTDGHSLLLMSDKALDKAAFNEEKGDGHDEWLSSNLRKWLNSGEFDGNYTKGGFFDAAFTGAEQSAIAESSKEAVTDVVTWYGIEALRYSLDNSGLENDRVFLLSLSEVLDKTYGFYPDMSESSEGSRSYEVETTPLTAKDGKTLADWRLRSRGGSGDPADVQDIGGEYFQINSASATSSDFAIVPALNLDLADIMFTTPAGSGKPERLEAAADGSHTEAWKLTLRGGRGFDTVRTDSDRIVPGGKLAVQIDSLGTADAGVEYSRVSAMIVDAEGTVQYYGKAAEAETGAADIDIPSDLADGTYTMKLFAEDVNGTAENALTDYASNMVDFTFEITTAEITSADVAVDVPAGSELPDTEAESTTEGVASVQVEWRDMEENAVEGKFDFNMQYQAVVTLTPDEGYAFSDTAAVRVNGAEADSVTYNDDGAVTAVYTFPATAKAKLLSIGTVEKVPPFAGGTALDKIAEWMNANRGTVAIKTEDADVITADVTWTVDIAEGSYDPSAKTEQTFALKGTVTLPDGIDAGDVSLEITASVTVEKAAGGDAGEKPGEGDQGQKPGSGQGQDKPDSTGSGKEDRAPQTGDTGTFAFALFWIIISGTVVSVIIMKRKRA
ncbi:MAG TPA: hypothetical protein H9852_05070 [Candidatus Mediterraneibacter colneyensis]|nr:hypothetical protein [Candidatus Mediterraneibacter colneyensis]